MLRFLVQIALLLTVTACAWRWGGKAEKQVAAVYVGMLGATTAIALFRGEWARYVDIPYYRAAIDLVALVAIVGIALRNDRWWVLWVGSAQLLAVCAHVMKIAGADVPPIAYAVMERWPIWLAIVMVGLGTIQRSKHARLTAETS